MTLLVGADPEVFVKVGDKFFSAHGLVPGTKKEPFKVQDGYIQVDGMALEFNIDPAATKIQFRQRCRSVFNQLQAYAGGQYKLTVSAVADFDKEHMKAQPRIARMLGCDPDFNAYTEHANPRPPEHPTMRTAAGHVHLGWTHSKKPGDTEHMLVCIEMVKQLDYFLGLPSVLLDEDTRRKELYGKAGAFRPKHYGCEYRVLSNFWLKDSKLMEWVFTNTETAFQTLTDNGINLTATHGPVADIINTNDKAAAQELITKLNIAMP